MIKNDDKKINDLIYKIKSPPRSKPWMPNGLE